MSVSIVNDHAVQISVRHPKELLAMRCIRLTGSDDRMDCRDMLDDPINLLPAKCPKCGFPDLDHVPQPYFLIKSRTMSPNELAKAENGNFFVRERVRQVLELLAPGQCSFFPTCYKGTTEETPWLLAVPNHQVITAKVDASIPRCDTCGEPRSAHPGSQFSEWLFYPQASGGAGPGWTGQSEYEILKSSTWGSSEIAWDQWISRDLFMSVRLLHLLKKIKAKGFYEATCGKPASADKAESVWIREKIQTLEQHGISLHPAGTLSEEDAKWFQSYLESHSRDLNSEYDIKSVEKRLKFKLPKSYLDFVTKVGPALFENIDEQEGFTVRVLAPDDLDLEGYRAGALDSEDEETNAIDGVVFADAEHGDCFCFDVQKSKKEFQVFLYKHEFNCFEPYAENFAACIKRFSSGGKG